MLCGGGMKHWEAEVGANADLLCERVSADSPTSAGDAHDVTAEEVTVIINNPISLVCEALTYPSPNITWLKDEVPLKASGNILLLPGTVLVSTSSVRPWWPLAACLGEWAWLVQGSEMVRSSGHQVDAALPCAASSDTS